MIRRTGGVALALFLAIASGCGAGGSQTHFEHESGIYFEFPEGWSVPGRQEWRDLDLGDDKTLVTVMDETRQAAFSIIPVNLSLDEQFTLNILDDDPAARAVMFVKSIDAAGPNRYEDYALISQSPVNFAGAFMGEIVFEGKNPGKSLKWHRLLALTTQSDAIVMFLFTAPADQVEAFRDDFYFIEDTWDWGR